MDNNQPTNLTSYQQEMASLYAEASANKYKFAEDFKKKFYPVDPFEGAWVSVYKIPIEVFRTAVQAAKELDENLFHSCWLDVFDNSLSDVVVRIDVNWLNKMRKHRQLIDNYITSVVHGNLAAAVTTREEIMEIDDFQLRKDLVEADEVLFPTNNADSEIWELGLTVNVEGMNDD